MILLAVIILYNRAKVSTFHLTFFEWLLLITGSLIMIFVYTQPYMSYMLDRFSISELIYYRRNISLIKYIAGFKPVTFNWLIYVAGSVAVLLVNPSCDTQDEKEIITGTALSHFY